MLQSRAQSSCVASQRPAPQPVAGADRPASTLTRYLLAAQQRVSEAARWRSSSANWVARAAPALAGGAPRICPLALRNGAWAPRRRLTGARRACAARWCYAVSLQESCDATCRAEPLRGARAWQTHSSRHVALTRRAPPLESAATAAVLFLLALSSSATPLVSGGAPTRRVLLPVPEVYGPAPWPLDPTRDTWAQLKDRHAGEEVRCRRSPLRLGLRLSRARSACISATDRHSTSWTGRSSTPRSCRW